MYRKIRFTSKYGTTAAMIVPAQKVDHASITEISRLFPMSEAMKMGTLEWTPAFETWDAAFEADFPLEGRATANVIH